jgi:hypothetical protein
VRTRLSGPLVVLERLGAVELLADVLGDVPVEAGLRVREFVGDRVSDALWEERAAVELEQVLLDHPPHQVGDLDLVDAVAKPPLEPVRVEEREEEQSSSAVGRRRQQQEVRVRPESIWPGGAP